MRKLFTFLIWLAWHTPYLQAQINPMSVAEAEQDNSVEAQLRSFSLEKGYQVELYASEELGIANPVTMRWDEKGRLWVLTISSYPHPEPGIKPNDKLLILEDTDGDGKADKSSVFADSLHMPLGFELGHGGVYLGHQTELLKLTDTNGDGKADRKETLLSGFGTHDSHQTINSFLWSPGGELFFSQGHSIYSRVETAWGVKKADRAAIWRHRPLTRQTDVFLDGSTASVNPWGMNFGNWGEMFHKANDPPLFYTAPGLVNTTHRQLLPPIGQTVIKGSIIEIARTKHLPDDLQGDFIVAGYYNNKVERMRVKEVASGYKAELLEPLLTSSSRSFRPVDIKIGPDGAIYVLDWYNPIIGHYQASMRHPDRDKTHGRIWKITATDRPLLRTPDLANTAVEALLDLLKTEDHWTLYQVRRLLAEKAPSTVAGALDAWVNSLDKSAGGYEKWLMEALNVCASHEMVRRDWLVTMIGAREPGARAFAARQIARWHDRMENGLDHLTRLVEDPHPQVRLEALVALSYLPDARAMAAAARVLDYPMDAFLEHALEKTTYALESYWLEALRAGELSFKSPVHLAWLASYRSPAWWTARDYKALLTTTGLTADTERNLLLNIAKTGDEADLELVTNHKQMADGPRLLEDLAELPPRPISPKSLVDLEQLLRNSASTEVQVGVVRLIRAWKIQALDGGLDEGLANEKADDKVRGEMLLTLVELNGGSALGPVVALKNHPNTSRTLRLAALKALLQLDLQEAVRGAVAEIRRTDTRDDQLKDIVLPLVTQRGGIEALTAYLENEAIDKVRAEKIQEVLGAAGIQAPGLAAVLNKKSGGSARTLRSYSPAYVEKLAEAVKAKGSAATGRKVYEANATCVACHAINGQGGNIGPDLSAVGKGLSIQEIITEVLWPQQNIKEGYNQVVAETRSGEIIQGIKVFEIPETLYLKTAATGKTVALSRKDLKSVTETGSLMPEELLVNQSEEELRDLVRFLSELGN